MSNEKFIALSLPNIAGNEWKYVKDCLDTGWISSVGSYVTQFEQMVADFAGAKYGVAAVNGTAALHISLLLSGVKQHDYVILPNLTFVASANSIKYLGADPLLIDADPNLWQMDLDLLEEFLENETDEKDGYLFYIKDGRRIGAIMPVHILGNMCDMDRFLSIVKKYPLPIVEDATESLGTTYKGVSAGKFSPLACFSFNGNKIISTGGGGVIVTDDEALAKHAKHLTTTAKASADEYYHDEVGYNYRLVNVLAAIGVGQMELLPSFIKRKKECVAFYKKELTGVADIRFQQELPGVETNGWLFTIQTDKQQQLLDHLNKNKILSRRFWMPMNKLPMYKDCVYVQKKDNSDYIYNTCLSIPSSTSITDEELTIVVDEIKAAIG
ncbi:MAG: LegC family aminotransferase [Chitinophagaceae bacterium]|jgi:aminotransferase in exopolysaccharide biosynthesis|nr:LegC family aminotransferase [Chitinophagaceae bacterium]MBK7680948.1 LegC family aminotransferase [Chitinophagaceae bacterium]MBK9465361.1 LegC family aminotransferase [Chitinophagaceae bacterium]MBK9938163.1 LegC family aminotransferase [Chitinophagaceae bacterium]MBL0069843.1 LegC family aminotransferase [Chitinophagaceae bacterium]